MISTHVDIVIRVPTADLERARAIVAALDAAPIVEDEELVRAPDPESTSYREASRGKVIGTAPEIVLYKRIAAFTALTIPFVGGHLYARQYRSALLLFALAIASFVLLAQQVWLAALFPVMVIGADIAGATWHCDHITTGIAPRGRWRRFAPELGVALVAGWTLAAPHAVEAFAGESAMAYCRALERSDAEQYDACMTWSANARLDGVHLDDRCARCAEHATDQAELDACHCF